MKTTTLILLFVFLVTGAYSQGGPSDSLSKEEIATLESALVRSTFGAVFLADSFSRIKDTQNASAWFLKIDPYYFVWAWNNPVDLEKIFERKALTSEVKNVYRKKYFEILSHPKSYDYITFEKMHREDQEIRKSLEQCGDSFTCVTLLKRKKTIDSVHFSYLYEYTINNGWPSISNGSLYASTLAIHDGANADYYISLMKKAIIDGKLPLEPLKLIYYKKRNFESYDAIRKRIDSSVKFTFIVNSLMTHQLPHNLNKIRKIIKKHCPVELLVIYERTSPESHLGWWVEESKLAGTKNGNTLKQLFNELSNSCLKSLPKDIWSIYYLPSERKWDRIVLYVLLKPGHNK